MTARPKLDRLPGLRQLPGRLGPASSDLVFFDAWQGRVCDNPRAIHEELRRRDPERPASWTVAPGTSPPLGARGVRPGGARFLRDAGRARAVVANNTLPGYFRKARGARYIQAWHGTPLKRIAFDLPQPWPREARRYLRHVAADVSKWDYLVSPSPFATEVLRRAFRYDGEVLETGYPRNDLLANDTDGEMRRRTRQGLGIREEDHVVLYAPTFRDDGTPSFGADPERMAERLGEATVVLVRAHSLVADQVARMTHPRVRDVSGVDDIRELYLAADVLVTDYSSVMFDFAVTGRPIVLFCFDLERYRDVLRGFYFDFEAAAPGPLVADEEELLDVLSRPAEVAAAHAEDYRRFALRFCPLDDGGASARVVSAALV